jgi:alpha-glucosidase
MYLRAEINAAARGIMKDIFPVLIAGLSLMCACGGSTASGGRGFAGDYEYTSGYTIEDESLIPKQLVGDSPVQIYAWGTADDTIRIRAVKKGVTFINSPFLLTIPASGIAPIASGSEYSIGNYTITPVTGGYELKYKGVFRYRSVFSVSGSNVTEAVSVNKSGDADEYFWGMGSSSTTLVKDSDSYTVKNRAAFADHTYMYIPFVCSSEGSAFYRNAGTSDTVTFGAKGSGAVSFSSSSGFIDGYYYHKDTPKAAVGEFYSVSGSKSLLPRWAYGFIQSKYGYQSQAELTGIVNRFGTENIPLSAVVLDLYWFENMGDYSWNYSAFPDPKALDTFLESKGVKLITITEPYVLTDSKSYDYFDQTRSMVEDRDGRTVETEIWLGACGMLNPVAKSAWSCFGMKYASFAADGVDGFWTDLGEPEADAAGGYFDTYSMDYFHNYYNREWSRLIHKVMKDQYPGTRVLNLSRSGFTGSGGYGVSHWSGDVSSSFSALADQIPLGINDGIGGFSYWGSDVGGFLGDPSAELYVRWIQFGAFTPVFRAHGNGSAREPWIVSSTNFEIVKKYIKQRYKLLPYIYSAAWQTASAGIPMMRALTLDFPSDASLYGANLPYLSDEYMFGDSLLVAPVTAAGASTRNVYLPGSDWYLLSDFSLQTQGSHSLSVSINEIPVFIRKGGALPWDDDMNGETDTVYLFPDASVSTSVWYEDDGMTNGYLRGEGEEIAISLSSSNVTFSGVKTARSVTLYIMKNPAGAAFSDKFVAKNVDLAAGSNSFPF